MESLLACKKERARSNAFEGAWNAQQLQVRRGPVPSAATFASLMAALAVGCRGGGSVRALRLAGLKGSSPPSWSAFLDRRAWPLELSSAPETVEVGPGAGRAGQAARCEHTKLWLSGADIGLCRLGHGSS